jgi:ABC-2 type transport system permease protein
MSALQRFPALVKRELLEYRRGSLYAPFVMGGILLLLMAVSFIWNGVIVMGNAKVNVESLLLVSKARHNGSVDMIHQGWMLGINMLFRMVMICVMLAYALGCLIEERKDKSTLFWRSLPVRDWETVLAKCCMLLLVIPGAYLLATIMTQVIAAGLWAIAVISHGLSAQEWVFSRMNFFRYQGWQTLGLINSILLVSPVFAWCMFCSGYVRQRPFLMAMGVPFLAWLSFQTLNIFSAVGNVLGGGNFLFGKQYFARIFEAAVPVNQFNTGSEERSIIGFENLRESFASSDLWIGLVVAIALLATVAWIRRYREDVAQ